MSFDVAPYLRLAYEPNARGPDSVDCWGLCRLIYERELGLTLPAWDTLDSLDPAATAAVTAKESAAWIEVPLTEARSYDVLLLLDSGRPIHVGLVLSPPSFLHCARGFGTVVASYADRKQVWRKRVVGCFRHPRLADPDFRPAQAVHPRPHHP